MSLDRCSICGEIIWSFSVHTCKQLFTCGFEDLREEEGVSIRANSAQEAAEELAIREVSNEGDTGPFVVFVSDGITISKYDVEIRIEPAAYSTMIDSFSIFDEEEE